MKAIEYRAKSLEDLYIELKNGQEKLFHARFNHATGQLGKPLELRGLRREIAKIKTIIRERELGIERKVK